MDSICTFTSIQLCRVHKKSNKQQVYILSVMKSNGAVFYIGRTYEELRNFRKQVNSLCSSVDDQKIDPLVELPGKGKIWFETKKDDEKKKKAVNEFCQQVLKLPESILRSITVYDFFSQDACNSEEGTLVKLESSDPAKNDGKRKSKTPDHTRTSTVSADPSLALVKDTSIDMTPVTAESLSKKPRVRAHAYEEIVFVEDTPTASTAAEPLAPSHTSKTDLPVEPPADASAESPVTSHYARVMDSGITHDVTDHTNRPISVEYADIIAITPKSKEADGMEMNDAPTLVEEYANAMDTSAALSLPEATSTESSLYAEVVTSPICQRQTSTTSYKVTKPTSTSTAPTLDEAGVTPRRSEVLSNPLRSASRISTTSTDQPLYCNIKEMSGATQPAKTTAVSARRHRPKLSQTESPQMNSLTPIPPMPPTAAARLPPQDDMPDISSIHCDEDGEVQVAAIADYESGSDNMLSFRKGMRATLVVQSDTRWWCVRMNGLCGWVPADYWRMITSGDCASLSGNGSAPWFSGKLSRSECEALLTKHGKQQHFFIRESTNLPGHYALSVKYNDVVHHFPIELTADKKYNIGKHDFKTVTNIISYYKKNPLFYDESGVGVTLGNPLVVAEERQVTAAVPAISPLI